MTPKAIIFDLGKVLVDFDWMRAARRFAARCPLPAPLLLVKFLQANPLVEFEKGRVTPQQFFDAAQRLTGFKGTYDEFVDYFSDIFTEMPEMTAAHAKLRAAGFPTFIFSNTNILAVEHIRAKFPFFANFDGYIYSFEHDAMKPEARLYEVAEQMSGRRGADLLYLDDREENIAAGAARGWQVILQEDPGRSVADMQALGLPV
jgi:epoxide hydrolase-like predicted phosphatase